MFWTPERIAPSGWLSHVPFAFWLVDVLRPRTIVELGTHTGVSYSAMCQAVKSLELATRCFAVDTWKGDEHSGLYSEEVYREFSAFHDARYAAFSRLVRSTFDEALPHFEDKSIDLLHIDGFHTYDAVRHDFDSWVPRLSENGVVMVHDINVRERGFGVFKLWGEISSGRPHFSFVHGHGFGILGLGSCYPARLRLLFSAEEDDRVTSAIRTIFSQLGRSIDNSYETSQTIATLNKTIATLNNEITSTRDQNSKEVTALNEAIAALKELVAALQSTVSWRLTAPLRYFKDWMQKSLG
jgi:hypothetical protein